MTPSLSRKNRWNCKVWVYLSLKNASLNMQKHANITFFMLKNTFF